MKTKLRPASTDIVLKPIDRSLLEKDLARDLYLHSHGLRRFELGQLIYTANEDNHQGNTRRNLVAALYRELFEEIKNIYRIKEIHSLLNSPTSEPVQMLLFENFDPLSTKRDADKTVLDSSVSKTDALRMALRAEPFIFAQHNDPAIRIVSMMELSKADLNSLVLDPIPEVSHDAAIVLAIKHLGAIKSLNDEIERRVSSREWRLESAKFTTKVIGPYFGVAIGGCGVMAGLASGQLSRLWFGLVVGAVINVEAVGFRVYESMKKRRELQDARRL